ncbi:siderophore-interacting protein [Ornithinimicrobium sp. Arc0846-15]|nr:siderophore-interacting protein [Ornithinimicrobium laminariae]
MQIVAEDSKSAHIGYELRPRTITVESVIPLADQMVRIRFGGDDLRDLPTASAKDHVKLLFDWHADGTPKLPAPGTGIQGLAVRDYTIRELNRVEPHLDIDFVLHDHGIAGRWAQTAKRGNQLGCLGPRGSMVVKDVFDWYVFAADETSLPALGRWVGELRPDTSAHAYIEVDNADAEITLRSAADLTVTWLHRNGAAVGTTTMLADAVRGHELPNLDGYVWAAGEAGSIKPIRGYLADEAGLDRANWDVDGYWRLNVTNFDHHADED